MRATDALSKWSKVLRVLSSRASSSERCGLPLMILGLSLLRLLRFARNDSFCLVISDGLPRSAMC